MPVLLTYLLSFVYLGIYWNNHHHMLHAVARVNGADPVGQPASALLAVARPVRHRWMGEHQFPPVPTAVYGIDLLAAAIAYYILQRTLMRGEGRQSHLRAALGTDVKGKVSPILYVAGIGATFVDRWLGIAVYVGVALIWLVPDRRLERHLTTAAAHPTER